MSHPELFVKSQLAELCSLPERCRGQVIPDTVLSISSATAGANPLLFCCGCCLLFLCFCFWLFSCCVCCVLVFLCCGFFSVLRLRNSRSIGALSQQLPRRLMLCCCLLYLFDV